MANGNFRVAGYQKDSSAGNESVGQSQKTPETTQSQQPATIWTGRSGAGYETVEAANQALETRTRKDPEMDWKVEQRPDGKYHAWKVVR